MVLGLRETPLSPIALENAHKLAQLGVTIMPLSPGFYFKDMSPDKMIQRFVDHMLTMMNLDTPAGWRSTELPAHS